MNRFAKVSTALLVVALSSYMVFGDVQTSTPCSLSFYRYLFNLPGEKIRPNVPEGTYVFGKRVGPPTPEGQSSNLQPSILKPAPSYEAPQYLPPPAITTTTTTTTTPKPSTSAPEYIPPPPPSPYYEASNAIPAVLPAARPTCDHPEHQPAAVIDAGLLPPYRFDNASPKYQPQPTFFVPQFAPLPQKFAPLPQKSVPTTSENEIIVTPSPLQKTVAVHRYPVPTPPPQFLRPYVPPSSVAPIVHENCEKHHHAPTTYAAPTTTYTEPTTTPEAVVVETRQNEITITPEETPAAHHKSADCGGHNKPLPVESLGVPSTDYGVVQAAPAPSAGYSYDKPSVPFVYQPTNNGYAYPKPSPSFEYPSAAGYAAQGTALFESEPAKASSEDGDLVVLKV